MTGRVDKASLGFRARETGNIMPAILIAFFLIMLTVGTLIQVFASNEEAAIDQSLAEIQAYWAMQGALDYSLSRLTAGNINDIPPLTAYDDSDIISTLSGFAATSTASSFGYFAAGSDPDFRFNVSMTTAAGGVLDDGVITATFSLAPVSTTLVPLLQGFSANQSPLVVDLCVGDEPLATRTNGVCDAGLDDDDSLTSIDAYRRR